MRPSRGILFTVDRRRWLYGCIQEELKETIRRVTANIPAEPLQGVNQNLFRQREEYLRVEGQHFQHLGSVNCNYFILNVIGQKTYRFVGKIRMRLAAGGAPIAVKRSALNPSTKVAIPLYIMYMCVRACRWWDNLKQKTVVRLVAISELRFKHLVLTCFLYVCVIVSRQIMLMVFQSLDCEAACRRHYPSIQ
jgi:hypothetical protein